MAYPRPQSFERPLRLKSGSPSPVPPFVPVVPQEGAPVRDVGLGAFPADGTHGEPGLSSLESAHS